MAGARTPRPARSKTVARATRSHAGGPRDHRAVKTAARATNVLWLNTVTLHRSDGGDSGASPEGALQASEGAGLIDRHHFATQ